MSEKEIRRRYISGIYATYSPAKDIDFLLSGIAALRKERDAGQRVITAAYEVEIAFRMATDQSKEMDELYKALEEHNIVLSDQEVIDAEE